MKTVMDLSTLLDIVKDDQRRLDRTIADLKREAGLIRAVDPNSYFRPPFKGCNQPRTSGKGTNQSESVSIKRH